MVLRLSILAQRACRASTLLPLVLLAACGHVTQAPSVAAPEAVFTVQAPGQRQLLRVLTRSPTCPAVRFDARAAQAMATRATPATLPLRDTGQAGGKPAVMDVMSCELPWPAGVRQAEVAGQRLAAPHADIRRILIVADTGCRMKASENAFQDCHDAVKWPWAEVARSAAAKAPDLVIHIGDIHYRESPCPSGNAGCADSPWGYGFDAWQADFFQPARPLLAAAPWLFVRGNHESCNRAGQGWFRFLDAQPWSDARSCNDAALDAQADFSEPWAMAIAPDTQLLIFDSSKTSGKPYTAKDAAWAKYAANLDTLEQLVRDKPQSFFLSHHPLLAFAPVNGTDRIKPGGTAGLQSVMAERRPDRFFADGISLALHGHVHLFESLSFRSAHPATLVLGNAGSANEGRAPLTVPTGAAPWPGAELEDYIARSEYGFATLDRVNAQDGSQWLLTEYTTKGQAVISCDVGKGKSRCRKLDTPAP
jgi:hypothetical protein